MLVISIYAQPGSNDPTFNQSDRGYDSGVGANEMVRSIAVQNDGRILICGQFGYYNNKMVGSLCRLNPC